MRREPVHVLFIDHVPLHVKDAVTAYASLGGAQETAQAYCDDQRAIASLEQHPLDWHEDGGGRVVADDVALEADFIIYFLELGA